MEELNPESSQDRFAEGLNYMASFMQGTLWNTEVQLLDAAGYLGRPAGSTYEKITSLIKFIPSYFIGSSGFFLLALSNKMHSREYVYWKGEGELISPEQAKVMHFNACMFPGSLPYHFGGLTPATERMDKLFGKIESEKPDILFLSEFGSVFSGELYERLKENYKHFFVNIGMNALGLDASMAVVSKVPIFGRPEFIPTKIKAEGEQELIYRGYFIVETEKCNYLYAHLHPKETEKAKEIRKGQLDEIREITSQGEKPWVILGDLNIDRNKDEYETMSDFNDYLGKETITCEEGETKESIDYVLTRDGRLKITVDVKPDLTLSDHSAVIATIALA